jgi:hypothetical protein
MHHVAAIVILAFTHLQVVEVVEIGMAVAVGLVGQAVAAYNQDRRPEQEIVQQ